MEEEKITLQCLECGKQTKKDANCAEAVHGLNYFCDGDCEDKYAWKQ